MDIKNLAIGVAMAAAGIILTYRDITLNIVWKTKNFVLPKWLSYSLDGLLLLVGVLVIVFSLRKKKCNDCNKLLENADVHYDIKDEEQVLQAVNALNAEALSKLKQVGHLEDNVWVNLSYCDHCAKVAEWDVSSSKNGERSYLITTKEVHGDNVEPMVKYFRQFAYED